IKFSGRDESPKSTVRLVTFVDEERLFDCDRPISFRKTDVKSNSNERGKCFDLSRGQWKSCGLAVQIKDKRLINRDMPVILRQRRFDAYTLTLRQHVHKIDASAVRNRKLSF